MKLKIAVIGSGTAGASVALFLQNAGCEVVVFEREQEPKPIGAGVMLQPTGLNMLYELDLGEEVEELGTKIHRMLGIDGQKKVVDLHFDNPWELKGLGVHRGALFSLLHKQLYKQNIPLLLGAEIDAIEKINDLYKLSDTQGNFYEGFNLVIVANGSSSRLRQDLGIAKKDIRQKWGAIWAKIPCDNQLFNHEIYQIYKGSQHFLGLMPIGKPAIGEEEYVNFFWSIRMDRVEKWRKKGIEEFKKEIKSFVPKFAHLFDSLESLDDLVVAPYYDVELKPSYKDEIIFIGDSAHAMSPQLSQGTSFALLDAKVLSEVIVKNSTNIPKAFELYQKERKKQVSFYQKISRLVTPMFQSDGMKTPLRNTLFPVFCRLGITKNLMVSTALGYRKSIWGNIDESFFQKNKEI
ncbi:MAG: FAD-dependent monooxygenase [Cytophagales bacterium]|nr:FAD-dependent monooxygenase [Cytophagales bacterium]